MMRALFAVLATLALLGKCGADVITYLRFEENGGGIASDEMGLLDGELINFSDTSPGGGDVSGRGWSKSVPSATVPLTGEANTTSMRMNGGSAYIDLSNANTLSLGSEFTVEFYMNASTDLIIAPMFGFDSGSELYFLMADTGSDLVMRGEFQDQIDGPFSASLVSPGTWQHFALVMEPTEYTVCIDGQVQYNGGYPGGASGPYEFAGNVALGTRTIGGESGTCDGYIDEFRISDKALTPDQFLIAVPEPTIIGLIGIGAGWIFLQTLRRKGQSST
ncbi:MAG: LamG domain-containing protein [Spartobacteria bacterium]|nr:LamG domain-containing protein [Spartobacteria bacterium]